MDKKTNKMFDKIVNEEENLKRIECNMKNEELLDLTNKWLCNALKNKYQYNLTWLDRPIIQVPQDIYAIQELIWKVKPNLVIETGIAHGGSLIMSASMLALIDYCEGYSKENPSGREVIGIDIDIREHNKIAIENHPLSNLITMFEGSSVNSNTIKKVKECASYHDKIMVFLDSNHTHEHVLAELNSYASLVTIGSYCVVWDTGIEDLTYHDETRPWGKGNNPRTAVHAFLKTNDNFEIDYIISHKLLLTSSMDGFLRKVK